MSAPPKREGEWPDAETKALLDAIRRRSPFTPDESGPDAARLRAQALRVMLLRPLARLARRLFRGLRRRRGTTPAYRAETAEKPDGGGE